MKMVKVIDIELFELTVDEAFKVSRGTDILVYNTLFDKSRIYEGGRSIKNFWKKISPVLHSEIKFFVFKLEDVLVE